MQSGVERPSLQHLRAPGSGEGTSPSAGSASQVRPRGNGGSISSGGGAPGNSLPGETTAGETTSRASPAHGGVGGGSVNTSCNQVGGASFVLGPGKRRLCPYLTRKNGCYKGEACRYAHSEEEALSAALMQQAGIRNSSVGSPAVASAPSCVGTPTSGKSTVSASHPGLGIDPMASSVSTPLGGPGVGGPVALMLDPASTAGLLLLHSQPGDIPSSTLGPREDGVGLSPAALPIPLPVRQVAGVANTETLHKGQLARCVCTTGSEKLFANALKADGGTAGGDASSGVVSDGVPRVVTLGQQNAVAAHHHHSAAVQLGHHGLSPTAAAALAPGALHFQQGAVPALVMNSPGAVMPAPMGGPTPALKGGGDFQTGVSVEDAAAADATGHNSRQPSGVAAGRPVGSETPVPVAAAEIPSAAGGGVSAASGGMVGTGVMTGVQPLAAVRLPSGQTPPPTAAVAPPPYWPPGIQASPPQQQGVVVGPPHPHPQAAGALLAPGVGGPAVGTLIAPGAAAAGAHHHHHHPGAVAPGCLPTAFGLIAPPPPAIAGGGGQQQPAHHALMLGGHQGTALPATALLPSGAHPGFYFAGAPRAGSNTVMSIMPIPLMHFAASTEELNAAAPLFYED
ncbi:zinc finger (ccch type) motif-containing protein [Cystoisospora suis]|uniref:Zinc finger (Ccch type) motif-containing protein n=1 Tax=Cystoisospora suis TaxID=483139 RepID=A0A2C6KK02_9APIC|nr:zinc finger (ccch type) motif-containing protein [Cystoisospora suis]